jgi:histone acetyltransferase (RNA polymerase elongator complex component)
VEIGFYGGSFTAIPIDQQESLLNAVQPYIADGTIRNIRISTRPDCIDMKVIELLKAYNVKIVELGVQSMDDNVLKLSNRGHTALDVYRASSLIKEYGFTLGLQMMVGLPGDNVDKDLKTADEFIKTAPDMVRIYPALVIKDTYMEELFRKGDYQPLSIDAAVDICSKLYLKFEAYDINIIRIGLQTTESIQQGKDIVAGPFHPAFRELVESEIVNDIVRYLYNIQGGSYISLHINSRMISKLYADKKRFYNKMLYNINCRNVRVFIDDYLPMNTIKLENSEKSQIMSIKDYSLIN